MTYTFFRKIHLYASLVIAAFLLMYFITGYVMIHHDWFPHRESGPRVVESSHELSYAEDPDDAVFADYLNDTFDIGGRFGGHQVLDGGRWQFNFYRPGVETKVIVAPDADAVTITETHHDFRGLMNGYHRMHGYHGPWTYKVWTLLYDLASLSLIVFAATGVYLWWKLSRRRIWGVLCLTASWGLAVGTVAYIVFAR